MSIRQAQASIDAAEFAEWQVYDAIEPFGEDRADFRFGMTAFKYAAFLAQHPRRFGLKDFLPTIHPPKPRQRQTPEQMRQLLRMVTVAAGGTITKAG